VVSTSVSQRIHAGAGIKLVPNDGVLVGEPVEVLVEAAVVDWIGVALVEVVLECEAIGVVVDGKFQMDPWVVEASKWAPRSPPKSAAQTHLERATKE